MKPLRPGLLPVIFLVVIVAWALFAVAMLTGTLVAAQQIDNRVVAINRQLPGIDKNLKMIPLAAETGRIAGEISAAAKPVGPQFTSILQSVKGIQDSAHSVEGLTGQINTSVKTINTAVKDIGVTVGSIGTTLNAVNANASSINSSVHGINDNFGGILDRVRSIDPEVAGINTRTSTVTDIAEGIRHDLDRVRDPLLRDIIKNSAAIANSPVVNLLGLGNNPLVFGLLKTPSELLGSPLHTVTGPPPVVPPLPVAGSGGPLDVGLLGSSPPAQDSKTPEDGAKKSQNKDRPVLPLGGVLGGK